MKTYQTTIDGQHRRVTIPGNDDTDGAASDTPSVDRLAESLADARNWTLIRNSVGIRS